MNKKLNTAIFMIIASIFNILLSLSLFILFIVGIAKIFNHKLPNYAIILIILSLFAAMAITFFVYSFLMKKISEKWDLAKYLQTVLPGKKT